MRDQHEPNGRARTGVRWTFLAFLGIAGFFLIKEHQAHVLGALPYMLLFACVALHVLMHRGHGGHGKSTPPNGHAHGDQPEDKK